MARLKDKKDKKEKRKSQQINNVDPLTGKPLKDPKLDPQTISKDQSKPQVTNDATLGPQAS